VCIQFYSVCVQVYTVCVQFYYTDPGPGTLKKNYLVRNSIERGDYQFTFEPPDARAACDGIFRHFAYGSYLLKVW
jgi:hypothetical protein